MPQHPTPPVAPRGPAEGAAAHLIVPFARWLDDDDDAPHASPNGPHHSPAPPAWPRPADAPHLHALLRRAHQAQSHSGSPHSLTPPHEWALAHARGHLATVPSTWDDDTALPWARLAAAPDHDPHAAWVSPVHQQVGMDQVSLQPLNDLDDAHDRALLAALAPLAAEDGLHLRWHSPGRWHLQGAPLQGVATASLDRVSGRSVAGWLPRGPGAGGLRRLMAEAQMLFYTHPAHDERQRRGQLPVNAIWVSGCGAAPGWVPTPPARDVTVADALRAPALANDRSAWLHAWTQLDAQVLAPWLHRAQAGEPLTLSLCGEQGWLRLHLPAPGGLGQRLGHAISSFFGRSRTSLLVSKL